MCGTGVTARRPLKVLFLVAHHKGQPWRAFAPYSANLFVCLPFPHSPGQFHPKSRKPSQISLRGREGN